MPTNILKQPAENRDPLCDPAASPSAGSGALPTTSPPAPLNTVCAPATGAVESLAWAGSWIAAGLLVTAVGWTVMHWASVRLTPDPVAEFRLAEAMAKAELVAEMKAAPPAAPLDPAAVQRGKRVYLTCMACHGKTGEGIKMTGADLLHSKFVARTSDDELLNFVKKGRTPTDPDTVLKLTMPPKGGNPALKDEQIKDVITYIRSLQQAAANSK